MARIEKTVFISYRRTDVYTALAVYENLKNQGYDVFFDYTSISSGDFEQIIIANIKARAHFLIILTPTALDRCNEPGDWLRREIEIAIEEKRNIVPLLFKGFRFGTPNVSESLTGELKNLSRYNGLNVHEDYFGEAMHRLRTQFLNKPLDTVLHPVSTEVRKVVEKEQVAADKALEQIEDVRGLVRQADEKPDKPKSESEPVAPSKKQQKQLQGELTRDRATPMPEHAPSVGGKPANRVSIPWKPVTGFMGVFLLFALCIWGGISLWNNLFSAEPQPTQIIQPIATKELSHTPTKTSVPSTPSPTKILTPPTPTLGIGSTMIGNDGMTLLYVPAGEFTMGSDTGDANEKPAHMVYLDTFWIDKTEVTNTMYAKCVDAGVCKWPARPGSYSRDSYYGNSKFDNYPVIFVDWNMAETYCEWADRRLPTEAEWEKAARGNEANIYPWGNTFDGRLVNSCDMHCIFDWGNKSFDDEFSDTSPAGNYPDGTSPYGALDLAGNVSEWVADWYSDIYYASQSDTNPSGPDSGTSRVLRGGSWVSSEYSLRSSFRDKLDPTYVENHVGFRCARSP